MSSRKPRGRHPLAPCTDCGAEKRPVSTLDSMRKSMENGQHSLQFVHNTH